MGRVIGIDLGTTNSVIAGIEMGRPKILQNREQEYLTPSAVAVKGTGEVLVGMPALKHLRREPKDTILSIKRLMGRAISDPQVKKIISKENDMNRIVEPADGTSDSVAVILGDKEYSPIDISAMILKKLKEDAEFVLGEEVTHAVITVPAYFNEKQKFATREAGLQAGLKVMKLIDEPTAAAMAYTLEPSDSEPACIVVYDLGGGTFDISLLMMTPGAFVPLVIEGDMWLGGDNFDQLIIDRVIEQITQNYGIDPRENRRFMGTLLLEGRSAKEALSASRTAEIYIPSLLVDKDQNLIDIDVDITREWYEETSMPLIDRTISILHRAVENAKFTMDEIQFILMAGNMSSMPLIQQKIEELFGKEKVQRRVHPKHSVAIGAAMLAALMGGDIECPKCNLRNPFDAIQCEKCETSLKKGLMKITCPKCGKEIEAGKEGCQDPSCRKYVSPELENISPFSYAIRVKKGYEVFIEKGDPYETKEDDITVKTLHTMYPNQRIACFPVYGADDFENPNHLEKQGEVVSIIPFTCPAGTPLKVKLWLDENGTFLVDATLGDGRDIEELVLRGDIDQKAVDTFLEAEEAYSSNKDNLKPSIRDKLEAARDSVINKIEKKQYEAATSAAEKYLDMAKEEVTGGGQGEYGENVLLFATHMISEYGWVIEKMDLMKMELHSEELRGAQKSGNDDLIREKTQTLENDINTILTESNVIQLLFGARIAMATAEPDEPILVRELGVLLSATEEAIKNQEPGAEEKINALIEGLNRLPELPEEQKIECYKEECRFMNKPGAIRCENCGTLLLITESKS